VAAFDLARQAARGRVDDETAAEGSDDLAGQDAQNRGIPSVADLTCCDKPMIRCLSFSDSLE
jgi:hypothetical protein